MPYYDIGDLIEACEKTPDNVFIPVRAIETAKQDLNLKSKRQIVEFVANGGLENLQFQNTAPWRSNFTPSDQVMVDAYEFVSGNLIGYVAFLYNRRTSKWTIKSLKLSNRHGSANYFGLPGESLPAPEEGE